jgi:gliding motility-associated-like protein
MRNKARLKYFLFLLPLFLFQVAAFAQITTATFNCTGGPQNYTIPPCVTTVTVEAWGAGGGGGGVDTYTGSPGGGGAYAYSTLAVVPGQVLTVYVGCGGSQGGACQGNGPGGAGGYGYGSGGPGGNSGPSGCSGPGGGGGGGSAVLNGATVLVVAGGGGGGGGGGNFGDGANGGGGGQAGFSQSSPGGILGASGTANGLAGSSTGADGAGGGGGGGGVVGGGGGSVPGTDYGGSGGAGGTSMGTIVMNGSSQTPGNAGSPNLCSGCAVGGAGGSGAPGVPGDVVISYTTPPALTSNIASTNGCASATATVTPTSGAAPYTYTWSPSGGNAASASGLTNGPYTVNFTDANGCTGTNNITINLPTPVTGTVTNSPGACGIATATVVASGGTGGYTYTWSPSGGNAATANISNGTFTVNITDAMGCTGTATTSVVLPPALTITATTTSVTCNGLSNGSATATVGGGTGPTYTVAINSTPIQFGITGSTFAASGLPAGSYTFGVQDGAGCQSAFPITITEPAVLQQTLTATSPICVGASSTLSDAVSGGTAPYTVTWSSGGSSGGALVTTTVSPATTTTYSASVLDVNNCPNTTTVTVIVNTLPTLTANSASICVGSAATLTVTGASTYVWANAGGLNTTTGNSVSANPVTITVYTITGTDVNNCVNTTTSTVTVNSLPIVTVNSGTICVGGSVVLTASGANTYSWANATGLSTTTGSVVTANPVTIEVYTVTGTDVNNCVNTATSTVTVNSLPTVTVTSGVICTGSSIALTAGGANTYAWSPGTALTATNSANVTSNPTSTIVYTVTGTDANNCVNTATSTVTVNSLPIVAAAGSTVCITATASLTAGGGTTYAWSGPGPYASAAQNPTLPNATIAMSGVYTVTVTDANNCVNTGTATILVNPTPTVTVNSATICFGSPTTLTANGAINYTWTPATGLSSTTTSTVTANPATTTAYTITGDNGCTTTATATVTVNPLPLITATSTTICPNLTGTITAGGAGATGTYTWSTGANTSSITLSPASTTGYTVGGTDANGCINIATATITVNPPLTMTIGGNTPICQNTALNLTSGPGVGWVWSGPAGFNSISQNPTIASAQPNMSGTYSVTGTDAKGCKDSTTISITINALPLPVASNNSAICQNQTINFIGSGVPLGTYVWTGPNNYSVTAQNPAIVNAQPNVSGIYTVTVTDLNGCKNTDTTLVIVNANPVVTVNSPAICLGEFAVLFPVGAITYNWAPTPDLLSLTGNRDTTTNLAASTSFTVTGTNAAGCTGTAVSLVTVNPLPTVTVNSASYCAGGSATLIASGAGPGATYTWSPSTGLSSATGATVIANPAVSTSYTVTGIDVNVCAGGAINTVRVFPIPNLIVSPPTATGCEPLCVSFSNTGTSTGNYHWNFGDNKTDNTSAPTHCFSQGAFTVNVSLTDTNGCVNTGTANIVAFPTPVANFYATPQPTTILDPEIHFANGTSGGAIISTWHWNFGDGIGTSKVENPYYTYKDTGTFSVQLIALSDLGCADTVIVFVTIEDEYLIYVPNAFSPNFDGVNDVFMPRTEGVTDYKLYVYDRWGKLAFYTENLYEGWDGRHLNKGHEVSQEDVYVWKIEAKNKKGEPRVLKGTVSLIK